MDDENSGNSKIFECFNHFKEDIESAENDPQLSRSSSPKNLLEFVELSVGTENINHDVTKALGRCRMGLAKVVC